MNIAIVGGGIVGLGIGYKLQCELKHNVDIFEKEKKVGFHQSGRNSGVLHCGLAYKPGSLKAKLAVTGIKQMISYCKENNINHDICGKIIVATSNSDINLINAVAERGKKNGLKGLKFLTDNELKQREPFVKSLKTLLDGGLESRRQNIIFYATSNRRHLIARDMIENETSTAVHASESVEEKVSLSDRFGLWLGFHQCSQDDYFDMVRRYSALAKIPVKEKYLLREALEWQQTRGSRSGRVAWQFVSDLAGKNGINILKKLD